MKPDTILIRVFMAFSLIIRAFKLFKNISDGEITHIDTIEGIQPSWVQPVRA